MGDAANIQSQQSQQVHSIYGGIDRASPQPTFNSPTSGALHTLQQTEPRNPNHQRNQDYSLFKSSDTEVSVVLSFRASPNVFVPFVPIPLSTKTRPSEEIRIRIQKNSSNGRRCQRAITTITTSALDIWGYCSCLSTTHFEQSNQRSGTHTSTKEARNTNHQRNQGYSPRKFSESEVSAVLSFRASPTAFAPSAPISLPIDTPEWRDPNTNSANSYNGRRYQQAIATSALDTWWH
jgi:hypothetical protein